MERIVGIDLGTTNSLVAYHGDDGPSIIPEPDTGEKLCPSVVTFLPSGEVVVGRRAVQLAERYPETTIRSVKRYMGLGPEHLAPEDRARYRLASREGEAVRFAVGSQLVTPPEVSAHILRELKRWAEAFFGEPVERAVITVPAYFNDSQRQATKDAGRLAGLEVLRLVNEPTAASLAYGLDRADEGVVAVYDLGGGTFDISILKLKAGIFEVLATCGDTHLGGDDFDRRLGELLLERLPAPQRSRPEVVARAVRVAEAAKRELTTATTVRMRLALDDGREVEREVSRREFEELVEPLVARTLGPCVRALKDAGVKAGDLREVVAVGGSTRVPCVRARMASFFGRPPLTELNPEEVVALGAGVQAGILSGARRDMLLLDVVPLSLGIETMGGTFTRLVDRNTTIPAAVKETFTTAVDNQTAVDIHVLQGERELAADNRSLARFKIPIDPLPAGHPRLEVTFLVDANGILSVTATDLRTGRERSVEVKPSYGLSDEEIERMLEESIERAEEDVARRQLAEARVEAEMIENATRRALATHAALLEPGEEEAIGAALERLAAARAGEDHVAIREAIEAVDRASQPFAQRVMDSSLREALASRRITEL